MTASGRVSPSRLSERVSPSRLSERVSPSRLSERVQSADWAQVAALIAQVPVAHVGFVTENGQPFVIPIAAAVDGADVLLHGSTGSRWLRLIAEGIPVSAAITALDGMVIARSAFESSMHYRSAVLFGRCTVLDGPAKLAALDMLTEALIPGRVAEVRRPNAKDLAATLVLRLGVEDFSLKVSHDWPEDSETDVAGDAWAGVVALSQQSGDPQPAPDLTAGIDIPDSVRRFCRT
jgi:nitroimidazol reductase NimA-like FMN-containing flavoprotein (pyridoxamine 5'-phosphate oxidase superfamily)